jgi:hypothetical protein
MVGVRIEEEQCCFVRDTEEVHGQKIFSVVMFSDSRWNSQCIYLESIVVDHFFVMVGGSA